jgi:hypothetical protein
VSTPRSRCQRRGRGVNAAVEVLEAAVEVLRPPSKLRLEAAVEVFEAAVEVLRLLSKC